MLNGEEKFAIMRTIRFSEKECEMKYNNLTAYEEGNQETCVIFSFKLQYEFKILFSFSS